MMRPIAPAILASLALAAPLRFTLVFQYDPPRSMQSATLMLNATDARGNNLDTSLLRSDFRYSPDPEAQP